MAILFELDGHTQHQNCFPIKYHRRIPFVTEFSIDAALAELLPKFFRTDEMIGSLSIVP